MHGAHPERSDEREPLLARLRRAAAGVVGVPRRASRRQVAELAARVDDAARGAEDWSDRQLDEEILQLRVGLRRDGLHEGLAPRGFALVREAARRVLGTPHYDVQLYGGLVMLQHGLAELETGEGKTLTATLPASLAALAGIPVHVITANDYLAERDADAMRPLYARLGLGTSTVVESEPDREARRLAYASDITYVTNKQVAFDYLRDRIALADAGRLARRLVAEPGAGADSPGILRGLCFALVDEADSVLVDDARTPLILSREGAPSDETTVRAALWLARSLEPGRHFRASRRRGTVSITAAGQERLDELGRSLSGPLAAARWREEWVQRALSADHLFERDAHYIVRDDRIQIIDQPTGRRAPDRSFEGGVHALIEAKEGLTLSPQRETIARISYQRFFRRYLRLGGMTGTAHEVARELFRVYGLATVRVPTRLPSRRHAARLRVLATSDQKWETVVERVRALHEASRPVLVGTSSVASSELLSEKLHAAALDHELLSARQDAREAEVVARAGEPGRITVATRMAGRGTDIQVPASGLEDGGLAVMATDLGEARRIDRQLCGRAARQGAPGSHEQVVSLQDRLPETHLPAWLRRLLGRGWLPPILVIGFTKQAQRAEERRCALVRRRLLESEQSLDELLAFSGRSE